MYFGKEVPTQVSEARYEKVDTVFAVLITCMRVGQAGTLLKIGNLL